VSPRPTRFYAKDAGLQIVLKGRLFPPSAPDLSVLITKLKRAKPDVISQRRIQSRHHPCCCVRRAKAASSSRCYLVTARATASSTSCATAFGADIDTFCNIDPVPAQLLDASKLAPGIGDLTKTMVAPLPGQRPARPTFPRIVRWLQPDLDLLTQVLPVAKEKYGGFDPDSIRKGGARRRHPRRAARSRAYGVKFYRPGTPLSGQNEALDAGGDGKTPANISRWSGRPISGPRIRFSRCRNRQVYAA